MAYQTLSNQCRVTPIEALASSVEYPHFSLWAPKTSLHGAGNLPHAKPGKQTTVNTGFEPATLPTLGNILISTRPHLQFYSTMCGRYALAYPPAEVAQRLIENGMPVDEQPPAREVRHGYNIAPGSFQPVYRALGEREQEEVPGGGGVAVRYGLQAMWWGLPTPGLPTHPSKTPHKAINIRDTTLRLPTGPWHTLRHSHRCLIPALGFYEWRSQNTPYFVKRHDGALMCFAGLWSPDPQSSGATVTYAIVTTAAAPQLRFLHERMPVMLEMGSEEARAWVDPGVRWSERLQGLCVPWEGELDVYAVPAEVGDVKKDQRRFIEPMKGGIESFFGKAAAGESKEEDVKGQDVKERDIKKEDIKEESIKEEDSAKSREETPSTTKTEPSIDDDGWEVWPEAYQVPPSESTEPSTPSPAPTSLKRARSVGSSTPAPASKATKSGNTPWVRSATSNAANRRTPPGGKKAKDAKDAKDGTQKITSFFRK